MKVIFVGIHNKPHLTPLCSSTKSGKLINRIIRQLPQYVKYEKTNLFDVDYFPEFDQMRGLAKEWYYLNMPEEDDVIVLLGAIVHKQFIFNDLKILKLAHPSSIWSMPNQDRYVDNANSKIKSMIS